jgi:flagellin-like protein
MALSEPESGRTPDKIAEVANTERAVSPIIGVILMVAVTVTLSAIVGTLIFGMSQGVSQTTPTADISFQETDSGTVSVTHAGGDTFDTGTVEVVYTNKTGSTVRETWNTPARVGDSPSGGPFSVKAGTEIQVVWTAANGGESYIIDSSRVDN